MGPKGGRGVDIEQTAIDRLRLASDMSLAYYQQPLIVTTSGGKDSDICLELVRRAGIPYEVQHSLTTADAPQTVYHVREQFRRLELAGVRCTINYPMYKGKRTSMWALIPQKLGPPTRMARYCCDVLKEQGGNGRMITTGVRWAESSHRANSRGIYERTAKDPQKRIIPANSTTGITGQSVLFPASFVGSPSVTLTALADTTSHFSAKLGGVTATLWWGSITNGSDYARVVPVHWQAIGRWK